MRRVILATAGVAVVAFVAAALGSAQTTATTGAARAEAKAPVLPKLPAEIANRKRLIVGAKCDTPPFGYLGRPGQERGGRRRDRAAVRPVRVRPRAAADVRLRTDGGPRAAADEQSGGSRHLDVQLLRGPRHADRLLAGVLQRHGALARQERLADPEPRRHPRQEGGDHERLDLRPLDEAVLRRHRGHRRRQRHERRPRLQPGPRRRRHVRRHVAGADRGHEPDGEDDRRPVPRAPYGIGIKQGNVRAQALGGCATQPDEAEGPLRADHPEQHRASLRARRS